MPELSNKHRNPSGPIAHLTSIKLPELVAQNPRLRYSSDRTKALKPESGERGGGDNQIHSAVAARLRSAGSRKVARSSRSQKPSVAMVKHHPS